MDGPVSSGHPEFVNGVWAVITKRVNRYYCEHCRKGGCSSASMRKHEAACTKNPTRVCNMCNAAKLQQKPIEVLLFAYLYDVNHGKAIFGTESRVDLVEVTPTKTMEVAEGCPACVLAAIRQHNEDGIVAMFDFGKAKDAFWQDVNDANAA